MKPPRLSVLFSLFPVAIRAGNPLWESGLRLQDPSPVVRVEVDVTGYAIRDNATQNSLVKRYGTMKPGAGGASNTARLWPDNKITYCWETAEAKTQLEGYFVEAQFEWNRGLAVASPDQQNPLALLFDDLGGISGSACTGHARRHEIMVIKYDPAGTLSSSLGLQGLPTMVLSNREDIGKLRAVANIAHELGHAIGLVHEHQNPWAWDIYPYSGSAQMPRPSFGKETAEAPRPFKCENLVGYAENVRDADISEGMKELACVNRRIAAELNFAAKEWLPLLERQLYQWHRSSSDAYDYLDWDSLMIYPTGAGGIGNAAPATNNQPEDANDHRADVLLRADGTKIPYTYHPSSLDIEAVKYLYFSNNFEDYRGALPIERDHPEHNKFETAFFSLFKVNSWVCGARK